MSVDFILPDIGEGIVECEIVEWRVKEGDLIEEDEPVGDVSTDKGVVEIPSMHSGRVVKLYYEQGDTAKVHSPLFAIALEGEEVAEPQAQSETAPAANAAVGPSNSESVSSPKATASVGKVLTTPAVRRVAREGVPRRDHRDRPRGQRRHAHLSRDLDHRRRSGRRNPTRDVGNGADRGTSPRHALDRNRNSAQRRLLRRRVGRDLRLDRRRGLGADFATNRFDRLDGRARSARQVGPRVR